MSEETLDAVITYLTEKVSDKIGAVFNLASEPGPEVLRMQAAITGVEITTEGMKAYEVVPVAAIFGGLKALTGTRDREVLVFLEVKLSDSETGEMVGAALRRIEGEKLEGTKDQLKLEHLKKNLDAVSEDAEAANFSHIAGSRIDGVESSQSFGSNKTFSIVTVRVISPRELRWRMAKLAPASQSSSS